MKKISKGSNRTKCAITTETTGIKNRKAPALVAGTSFRARFQRRKAKAEQSKLDYREGRAPKEDYRGKG
ncbi:MAG: hypothetical protein ABSB40_02245 [Nitrososphaeria archaeon]